MSTILGTPEPNSSGVTKFLVKVDGIPWPEVTNLDLELRSYNAMGVFHFHVPFALVAGEGQRGVFDTNSRAQSLFSFIGDVQSIVTAVKRHTLDVYAGYVTDPNDKGDRLPLVFSGILDRATVNRKQDSLTISGRDRAAIFQETFIHAQVRNQKVVDFIREQAQGLGFLTTDSAGNSTLVDTGSTVGTLFEYDDIDVFSTNPQGQDLWTIFSKLANNDGHAIFTLGNTLYKRAWEQFNDLLTFEWGKNIEDIELEKNFGINSGRVGIEIASGQAKTKDNVVATAGAVRGGDALIYRDVFPGISQDLALIIAELEAIWHTQLEYIIEIFTIGAPQQTVLNAATLNKVSPQFDGRQYRIIRVKWSFGMEQGWQAQISGISAPPPDSIRIARRRQSRYISTVKQF